MDGIGECTEPGRNVVYHFFRARTLAGAGNNVDAAYLLLHARRWAEPKAATRKKAGNTQPERNQ